MPSWSPCYRAAATTAAAALLPPLRYCRAAALLPCCPSPLPCCCRRCRAATALATLPPPSPCCRRHRRAAAASAAMLPPLPPPLRATQAQLVLGKMKGMVDGWCWGWRGGVADYWIFKKQKRRRQNFCLWTGLIHRGEESTKSGYKKTKRGTIKKWEICQHTSVYSATLLPCTRTFHHFYCTHILLSLSNYIGYF